MSNQISLNHDELVEITDNLQGVLTALYGVHFAIEAPTHAIMTYDQLRGILQPLTDYLRRIVEHDLEPNIDYLAELVKGADNG